MPQKHLSVIKRARQNSRRNERNSHFRSALRTSVKKVVAAAEAGEADSARELLPQAVRALGKARSKGIIHRNQAARKISRLTRRVNALTAASS